MVPHEEFLQLCAAATAGELAYDEQRRLDAHLETCAECRRTMQEYEVAAQHIVAVASQFASEETESDRSWSVEEAEKGFLKRLSTEKKSPNITPKSMNRGQRFGYRPSIIHWREMWMSVAAVVLLALAVAVTAYRTGLKRGADIARTANAPIRDSTSLGGQVSDSGDERAQLVAKLEDEDKMIVSLKRQLSGQDAVIVALKARPAADRQPANGHQMTPPSSAVALRRDQELATAQAKLIELQKTIGAQAAQWDEIASRAAVLQARVGDLTQLVRDRERELEQNEDQVAKDRELIEHDRDIRELIGARDLYMADVHDVSGKGTEKTYGRIFYTRGKRLVFYAYDLDAQHGIQETSTFQAWGRRGPNTQQALNLGVFYEDNASKKRWVLRANNPKSLGDIDAVFVTIEPNGGSRHPSGKQLLFAYLRISPNHP